MTACVFYLCLQVVYPGDKMKTEDMTWRDLCNRLNPLEVWLVSERSASRTQDIFAPTLIAYHVKPPPLLLL
jgi:hypothetical protein